MKNKLEEITYNLLQNEYFRRRGINVSLLELRDIIKMFPEDWFLKYSIDERINIITLALKNNIKLDEVIDLKIK